MVTYIVQTTVQYEAYDEYVAWLQNEHIADILTVPGFISADLCLRKGGAMESSAKEIRLVFKVKDEDHIKSYISDYAMKLREKALDKFPGKFSSSREVWLDTINFVSK
jgi:antibiotic biosynthesis monooxygenase (ABM) superfamily enzyme